MFPVTLSGCDTMSYKGKHDRGQAHLIYTEVTPQEIIRPFS